MDTAPGVRKIQHRLGTRQCRKNRPLRRSQNAFIGQPCPGHCDGNIQRHSPGHTDLRKTGHRHPRWLAGTTETVWHGVIPQIPVVIQHWVAVGIFLFLKVKSQSCVLVKNGYQVARLNKKTSLWWYSRSYKEGPSPSPKRENGDGETFSVDFNGFSRDAETGAKPQNVASLKSFKLKPPRKAEVFFSSAHAYYTSV